jgi:prophage antirepressor-like protein
MNELTVFENSYFGKVRTCVIDGEPGFVAKDVAEALGYADGSNPSRLFASVPAEWKGVNLIHTPGGEQEMLCSSE